MTAELVRGQNHPLPQTHLEIRIAAGQPVVAGATLGDEEGRLRDPEWIAHPGSPRLPGVEVSQQAAANHRLAVDLEALPEGVERVHVLLALPVGVGGPTSFGAVAAPFTAVTGLDGTEIASYTLTELTAESAVVALELYLRRGVWKVRAVGQGYAGGLAAMLADQGLPEAGQLARTIEEAVAHGMARSVAAPPPLPANGTRGAGTGPDGTLPGATGGAAPSQTAPPQTAPSGTGEPAGSGGRINYQHPHRRSTPSPAPAPHPQTATPPPPVPASTGGPVAGDATGWSMDERLYNQVWGVFEDLARATAAYRSAVQFAESRMEQELDRVLSDPAARHGSAGDSARAEAQAKHDALVAQAKSTYDQQLAQLSAEMDVVEPAMPPAYARWDNPVWQAYKVPMEMPMALRIGDLSLPESGNLRVPMLVRLPLERGLWIDSGRSASGTTSVDATEVRRLATVTATALAARLLAVYPIDEFAVRVIDPAGSAAAALEPLVRSGALREPPAVDAAGVSSLLGTLTQRVDLVQMAVRARAADALPEDVDTAEQLLIVHDFPHGFDDRAVTQLRYLADEGPSVGVHLMMVADREDAQSYGPLLDPLWRSLLRITPVPDDHLADPWVGHAWTYEPPLVPPGSAVLPQVLDQVRGARDAYGRS